MARLFVAVRPPPLARACLLAIMGGVGGARWQSDEQLHLTLRFVGETDRHAEADLIAALSGIRQEPFAIALAGFGSFERRGATELIWAGVTPQEPLKALARKVEQACQRVGLPPDSRAYLPHITVARLKRGAGPIRHLLEAHGGLTSPSFAVDRFCLYESDLSPGGAAYTVVERFDLARGS